MKLSGMNLQNKVYHGKVILSTGKYRTVHIIDLQIK